MFNRDKNFENRLSLTLTVIFAFIITFSVIYLNSTHSILGHSYRDIFFYLIQSLRFSGTSIGGYEYVNYLPPVIPFLTSLFFRLGFVSEVSIFITSGIFYFFAILGMYYILKLKFSNFYSFFGAFMYGTLLINLNWVGNGTLDIAFISVMIWALYFFIQGVEKNQKYFYIAFPLATISFFTKYPAALIWPLMILYFMAKTDFFKNLKKYFKNLFGGLIAGGLTSLPFFAYFLINKIPFGFINQADEISSKTSLTVTSGGKLVGNDLFFYFKGLFYYIASTDYFISIIIIAIMTVGAIIVILTFKDTIKDSFLKIRNDKIQVLKFNISANAFYCILALSIVLILTSFFTASLFSFIYSEIILFLGLFLFSYSFSKIILKYEEVDDMKKTKYPYLALNIVMAGFFLSYLVFFSSHLTKVDRYFTSMAPGFIFLLTLSVDALINKMKSRKINYNQAIPIIMMILMLFASLHFILTINDDDMALSLKNASQWLEGKDGIMMSDLGPALTWYLQKEVSYAGFSYDNKLLNKELLNRDAEYYIAFDPVKLTDYSVIKEFDDIKVYERI